MQIESFFAIMTLVLSLNAGSVLLASDDQEEKKEGGQEIVKQEEGKKDPS